MKERLTKSDAAWKLCACSIPMLPILFDYNPLGETIADQYIASADSWDGYPTERRELLDYDREQHVGGFVSLAADLHMHFPVCSPLTLMTGVLRRLLALSLPVRASALPVRLKF